MPAKKSKKSMIAEDNPHYHELLEMRSQLIDQIRSISSATLATSKQAGEELADVGSDDFIRETELTLMNEEGERLALIQAALERFEEGTYGECTECGESISEGRLKAIPYATLCISCKTLKEKNERHVAGRRPQPPGIVE